MPSTNRILIALALIVLPAQALAQAPASVMPQAKARDEADFKVAYWYDRHAPLDTFRFQPYDVRKGQYTKAVDDWLEQMKSRYPHYRAYVKSIVLKNEPTTGSSDKVVASAMIREYLAVAGPNQGYGMRDARGLGGFGLNRGMINGNIGSRGHPIMVPPMLGSPFERRSTLGPPPPTFPNPYPYSRPHP